MEDSLCTCCKELRGMDIILVKGLTPDLLECPECFEEYYKINPHD